MSMNEIERALRELRLSGILVTLSTRILQSRGNQEPFRDTFSMILQDKLDRRRSSLTERRYNKSGLDEHAMPTDFDWCFNPKLPRQACFELHTLKFIAEGQNALLIGKPGTGKSYVAKTVAYQATLQDHDVHYLEAVGVFAQYALGSHADKERQLQPLLNTDLVVLDEPEKLCASTNWQVIVGKSPIQERSSKPSCPRVMRCTSRGVHRSVDRGHQQASH